jgi:hypothetical protein
MTSVRDPNATAFASAMPPTRLTPPPPDRSVLAARRKAASSLRADISAARANRLIPRCPGKFLRAFIRFLAAVAQAWPTPSKLRSIGFFSAD